MCRLNNCVGGRNYAFAVSYKEDDGGSFFFSRIFLWSLISAVGCATMMTLLSIYIIAQHWHDPSVLAANLDQDGIRRLSLEMYFSVTRKCIGGACK